MFYFRAAHLVTLSILCFRLMKIKLNYHIMFEVSDGVMKRYTISCPFININIKLRYQYNQALDYNIFSKCVSAFLIPKIICFVLIKGKRSSSDNIHSAILSHSFSLSGHLWFQQSCHINRKTEIF